MKKTESAKRTNRKEQVELRRQQMWQTMRILRRFTLVDLVTTTDVNYPIARQFVGQMRQLGYVEMVKKNTCRAGDWAVFVLRSPGIVQVPSTRLKEA